MTLEVDRKTNNSYFKKVFPFYQERVDSAFKSPLESLVKLIPKFNNAKMERDELVACIKSKRDWEYWVSKFSLEETATLKTQFDSMAKDGLISQNALFDFMGIKEFKENECGLKLFRVMLMAADTHFFEWQTFLVLMGIIHKGTYDDKCALLYSLFDIDSDNCVSKHEMIKFFEKFFHVLKKVNFKGEKLKRLRDLIMDTTEYELNDVIIGVVDDVYAKFAVTDEYFLTSEELKAYLMNSVEEGGFGLAD